MACSGCVIGFYKCVQMDERLSPEMKRKLISLECPFNWVTVFTTDDLRVLEVDFHGKVREKLDTSNDDDFVEYGFPSGVCLIYEYIIVRRETRDNVKEIIDICEAKLKSVFENRKNHRLIHKARPAFVHVLQGCKAYFEHYYGNINSLQDVLRKIPDHNEFNQDIRACLNGIKAAFLLTYGPYKTTEIGVQCAKNAIELDSTEGWYYFLVGKGLYRHRRAVNRNARPSDEEIDFVQQARQLEFKEDESGMFLIEMYSEMIQKGVHKENYQYLEKIAQLCRSIYEITEDWYCLWRISRGLIRIRDLDQQCTNLAQQCLNKANGLSPNNQEIMFLMSQFYERKHDLSKALHYAQLATEYGGMKPMFVSNFTRLKYMNDRSKDLTPEFDNCISKAQNDFNRHVVMCLKARYLLQVQHCNLRVVLAIFARIIQEDPKYILQKEAKRNNQLNNLLPILFSDIQEAVKKVKNKIERDQFESELMKMKKLYPDLENIRPPRIQRKEWWNTYFNVYN